MRVSWKSGRSRCLRLAMLAALISAVACIPGLHLPAGEASAQDAASPTAATPVVLSHEEARFARLGGELADVLAEYGTPDWTDAGLVGYNSITLGGVDTITMVFYDANERVRSYLLVYLEQPEALDNPEAIARVVADVGPRDGTCNDDPLAESGTGEEIYACRGDSLQGIYTAAELLEQGFVGEDGAYSYAVNPTNDQFFEIAIRFGTDTPPEPTSPVPTEVPTPRPPLTETYPLVEDAGRLLRAEIEPGTPLSFSGTVLETRPSADGSLILMQVVAPDGSPLTVAVHNQDDLAGVLPGEVWTVFGVYTGVECEASGACVPNVYLIELA